MAASKTVRLAYGETGPKRVRDYRARSVFLSVLQEEAHEAGGELFSLRDDLAAVADLPHDPGHTAHMELKVRDWVRRWHLTQVAPEQANILVLRETLEPSSALDELPHDEFGYLQVPLLQADRYLGSDWLERHGFDPDNDPDGWVYYAAWASLQRGHSTAWKDAKLVLPEDCGLRPGPAGDPRSPVGIMYHEDLSDALWTRAQERLERRRAPATPEAVRAEEDILTQELRRLHEEAERLRAPWDPSTETRQAAGERLNRYLDIRAEEDRLLNNETDVKLGRSGEGGHDGLEHFRWFVRWNCNPRATWVALATEAGRDPSTISRAVRDVSERLNIATRRERSGRHPKN